MFKGEKLRFDDESRALYDAVAPTFPDSHFNQFIAQLDAKIPGKGPSRTGGSLWERYEMWREPFLIPKEKIENGFQIAIKECRAPALAHRSLSATPRFSVESVSNKTRGGFTRCKSKFY